MRPIPKKFLIHKIAYAEKEEKDRWGKIILSNEIDISHVRVEPSSKVTRDKSGSELQLSMSLIYDCKNSAPNNVAFAVDGLIFFNDQKYAIQVIDTLYDGKKLHHYEMGLIKRA